MLSGPHNLIKHLQRPQKPMAQEIINFQVSMDSNGLPDCKELFGGDSNKLLKYMKAIGCHWPGMFFLLFFLVQFGGC